MPVFNEEMFIKEAIDSILNQSFGEFEFIIIDDGSRDNTIHIIEEYNDQRIILFRNDKKGIVEQLNYAINKSRSDFIARMDADDISHPDRLLKQYNYLIENSDIDIVGSNYDVIDKNSKFVFQKHLPEFHNEIEFMMPVLISVCHASILVSKSALQKVNFYNPGYETIEDHKLFLDLINNGCKFYNIQEPLLKVRVPHYGGYTDKVILQDKLSYSLGLNYLNYKKSNLNSKTEKHNLTYQLALLEYYRGSIRSAQKYFLKSFLYKRKGLLKTLRYLLVTIFGQRFVNYMRHSGYLPKLSILINKFIGVDFHQIKKV